MTQKMVMMSKRNNENWMESSFHPVFNLQAFNSAEVVSVARYKNEFFLKCCSGNKHMLPNIYVTHHFRTLAKFGCQFLRFFLSTPITTYVFQKCVKIGTVFFFPCRARRHEFVPGLLGFFLLVFYSFTQLVNQPTAIVSTHAIQHGQQGIHGDCSCYCIHNGLIIKRCKDTANN